MTDVWGGGRLVSFYSDHQPSPINDICIESHYLFDLYHPYYYHSLISLLLYVKLFILLHVVQWGGILTGTRSIAKQPKWHSTWLMWHYWVPFFLLHAVLLGSIFLYMLIYWVAYFFVHVVLLGNILLCITGWHSLLYMLYYWVTLSFLHVILLDDILLCTCCTTG